MSVPPIESNGTSGSGHSIYFYAAIVGGVLFVLYLVQKRGASAVGVAASGAPNPNPNSLVQYIPTSETFATETLSTTGANSPIAVGNTGSSGSSGSSGTPVIPPVSGNPPPTGNPGGTKNPPPVMGNPPPPVVNPPTAPPPTNPAFAPFPKPPQLTATSAGGWWYAPGQESAEDLRWLERTQHTLGATSGADGFGWYYWTKGQGSVFGGPISQEWNDNTPGAQSRQDFENGYMLWFPGSDPANHDVKWFPHSGAAGGEIPTHTGTNLTAPPPSPFLGVTHIKPFTSHPYTVQRGDTAESIAARYGQNWQNLYIANKEVIDAGARGMGNKIPGGPYNNLVPGTVLMIPVN